MVAFLAYLAGGLGVGLGAFGAHALKPRLLELGTLGIWEKAVLYQLVHAVAVVAILAGKSPPRGIAWCWLAGIFLFSGSLYGLALGGPRWLGPITPVGGLCFLLGWGWAALRALRSRGAA